MEGTAALSDKTHTVLFLAVWAFIALLTAYQLKFWQRPAFVKNALRVKDVVMSFGIYFFVQIFLVPLLLVSVFGLHKEMSTKVQGWMSIIAITLGAIGVLCYFSLLSTEKKQAVLGKTHWANHLKSIGVGIMSWFLIFPIVALLGLVVSTLMQNFFTFVPTDQTAVQFIKRTQEYPALFIILIILVSIVVPIVEEMLFRGFLQSWLKNWLHPYLAILTAGFLFAVFHFSAAQGLTNVELIFSLFLLGSFMGYLYERQQSLLASIAMHGTFNFITILFILLGVNDRV